MSSSEGLAVDTFGLGNNSPAGETAKSAGEYNLPIVIVYVEESDQRKGRP